MTATLRNDVNKEHFTLIIVVSSCMNPKHVYKRKPIRHVLLSCVGDSPCLVTSELDE